MDFLSTTRADRLRNVELQDPTPYPQPQRVDTLVLFSIRKALSAVDQGRTSAECPDFPTIQSPTASHLNSSKLVSIDQARSVSAGIM